MNSVYKIKIVFFILLFFVSATFSGCAFELLEGLEASEVAAIGTESALLEESGLALRAATGDVIIANEEAFMAELQRVKIELTDGTIENSKLYVEQNGTKKYFGEIIDNKTINISEINRIVEMPEGMEMYRVKNDNVNVRSSPEIKSYNVFKKLNSDDIVLVEKRFNEKWFEVQIDKNTKGFIAASLLVALPHHYKTDYNLLPHSRYITCEACHGYGIIPNIRCTVCNGAGYLSCNVCYNSGYIKCVVCRSSGYIQCSVCRATGYLSCAYCRGRGYFNIRGYNVNCVNCHGQGQVYCKACNGHGQNICNNCNGQGQNKCINCNGQGQLACKSCDGLGYKKSTCVRCNGTGKMLVNY